MTSTLSLRSSLIVARVAHASKVVVTPRNAVQKRYLDLLEARDPAIVFATGPAGVSKTYLAASVGIRKLVANEIKRLVITRPAVSVDEEHGFLPGTLEDKMSPWMRPIYDVFHDHVAPSRIRTMIDSGVLEICPLAYMRGRTFDNAFVIADEMQNATPSQMKMLLTRLGANGKMVVTGDPGQFDRGYDENGLADFTSRLAKNPKLSVQIVEFDEEHVERHPAVIDILRIYG